MSTLAILIVASLLAVPGQMVKLESEAEGWNRYDSYNSYGYNTNRDSYYLSIWELVFLLVILVFSISMSYLEKFTDSHSESSFKATVWATKKHADIA